MGIKDFSKMLSKYAPNAIHEVQLKDYKGMVIAIDVSIYLYKFIRSAGVDSWLNLFINFMCCIKRNGIVPICVFDGKECPPEKELEQKRRRASMKKLEYKAKCIVDLVEELQQEIDSDSLVMTEDRIKIIKGILNDKSDPNELETFGKFKVRPTGKIDYNSPMSFMKALIEKRDKLVKQTIPIESKHAENAKKFLTICGIPWISARGEAEALCCKLAIQGIAHAILSEDADSLCYRVPVFLSKLDITKNTARLIYFDEVCEELLVEDRTLVDMLIMMECDYNSRIKGVGIAKIIPWLQEHQSIESLEQKYCGKYDFSCLIYRRCREIFEELGGKQHISPEEMYPKVADDSKILQFCKEHNIYVSREYILKHLGRKKITLKTK